MTYNKKASFLLKSGYKQKNVCSQARQFYVEALKLQKKTNRMKKVNAQLKNRLKLAKSFANRKDFEQFSDKLNATTIQFFNSQLKCQKRKLKGRRYNISDKILALSLYKTSPKGYRFLSTIFSLPSRKTLSTLLNKVPFYPGINTHIIENLKHQVKKLKKINKSCILLFDEMALEPGLTYDRTNDIIFGFENDDDDMAFSDHVLVFMLRGIKKK